MAELYTQADIDLVHAEMCERKMDQQKQTWELAGQYVGQRQ